MIEEALSLTTWRAQMPVDAPVMMAMGRECGAMVFVPLRF
jgi:hypothetical protein